MTPNYRSLGVGRNSYGGHDCDGGYSRERCNVVDYESRRYDGGNDQSSKRERVPRYYEEPRRRDNERYRMTYEGNTGGYYGSGESYNGHSSQRELPKHKSYEDDRRREDHGHEYHRERYAYEYEGCDRLGWNRRCEDEEEPRYADPITNSKYALPKFHGEIDPEVYYELEIKNGPNLLPPRLFQGGAM